MAKMIANLGRVQVRFRWMSKEKSPMVTGSIAVFGKK